MKTAEEWVHGGPGEPANYVLWNEEVAAEESIPVVRAIQADAFRHAAELCRTMAKFMSNPDLADTYFCAAKRLDMEAAALEKQT